MVVLANNIVNSIKLVEHKLYAYRPLFLDGSKDAKSAYRLIEEIFDESIKQLTLTPELNKAKVAAHLGVTKRTVERTIKKLVDEGRISYQHTSKGKGKYCILSQQNMQLPDGCLLLDSELTNSISLVTQANSSVFSIIASTKKPKVENGTDIKKIQSSSQDKIVPKTTQNLSLIVEPTTKMVSDSPCLFYSEQDIEDMVDGLTEDEEDCLNEQIAELSDKWEKASDSELENHLKLEFTKSGRSYYADWLWEKAQREVRRAYVIGLLEGQGYIYRNENISQLENQNNLQAENQRSTPTIASSPSTTTPNIVTREASVQNVANSTENTTVKNVAVFCVSNVGVSVIGKENSEDHRLPHLELEKQRQECRHFSRFSGLDATSTDSPSLYARTHAHSRMREVKVNKVYLNLNYINFLTLSSLRSVSISSIGTGSNTVVAINTTTDNHTLTSNQTQDSNNTSITPITLANTDTVALSATEDAISSIEKQETIATAKSSNTSDSRKENSSLKGINPTKSNGKKAKKAKNEAEEPTHAMIKRLKLDRISPKDFSLWKIIDGDYKIEQDSDGNYLLPNKLKNHPKSSYSFWDILAYAQTQKSIDAPASFSVSSYYSATIDSNITFHNYLEEKANSLIGKARKPTEPTPEEKLASEKAKQELEQQLKFENLKEQTWNNLPSDEQQSLLIQEIRSLKADKSFAPYYQKWSRDDVTILQDYATNKIKTKLAEKELVKNTQSAQIYQ